MSSASDGHRVGFRKIPDVLTWCDALGIQIVTLWLLSDDNIFRRTAEELDALYLINEDLVSGLAGMCRWRLNMIGRVELLPDRLAAVVAGAVESSRDNAGMVVNLGLAYGGRSDLLGAVCALVDDIRSGHLTDATEEQLVRRLSTAGQPDPDLIIRPSGVFRSSGFLLWQAALSEYYFTNRLWPDFDRADLEDAIHDYGCRQRRFGC
jgi:short-chain Z-isoprenyl diphosphate synthase